MRRWKRFFSNKKNKLLAFFLLSLYIICWFAPIFAPYPFDREDRNRPYHPPQKLHLFLNGKFIGPFAYKTKKTITKTGPIYVETKEITKLFSKSGDMVYLLGSDYKGRDVFSRILYGGAISLSISLIGALISFLLGSTIGAFSGYIGGFIDNVIMRLCELIMLIPGFYLMLSIRAAFPLKADSRQILFMIVAIMSMIGWAGMARVIRAQALSIKNKAFVLSAKAIGMQQHKIILKHVIPHTFSYSIVALAISIPSYILGESALSLIGLGVQEPYASWGNMLSEAMNISGTAQHPWLLFPGVMIFLTVMLYNMLGEGLKYALDIQETI